MAVGLKIAGGDFIINPSGQVEIVEQSDKCSRDFGKMIITDTEYPGNATPYYRYNPDYGTQLNNKNMYRGLSRMAVRDTVIMLLNEAINAYLRLQEGRTNLDYGEIITGVEFDVYYNVRDLRVLIVDIRFKTALGGDYISVGPYSQSIE